MSRFVDVDAFKEWLLENSINEREVEESKQIGIWIDAFCSMQNEQSDCEDCIKHGGDFECDRTHYHKGDAISRQAAIDVASRECHEWRGIFSDIEQGLKELPSIQPWKWIPVSERLPEVGVNVLVCDIDNDIYLTHMSPYKSFYDEFFDYLKNVVAWMPLPNPYGE